jgi:hypothetical protein
MGIKPTHDKRGPQLYSIAHICDLFAQQGDQEEAKKNLQRLRPH